LLGTDQERAEADTGRVEEAEEHHVEERHELQAERVEQAGQAVPHEARHEDGPDQRGEREPGAGQSRRGQGRCLGRDQAGREQAQTLARVEAIGLDVDEVVHDVGAGRDEGERDDPG
jgi:hypothetical protein